VLRTVGYRRWHIALAFLIESLVPSQIGGVLACLLALGLNGFALRIPMGAFRLTGVDLLGAKPSDYTGKIVAVSASSSVFPKQSECSRLLMPPRQTAQLAASGR
jgi:ABC-type antimicrobial peptide transport system permease subunit